MKSDYLQLTLLNTYGTVPSNKNKILFTTNIQQNKENN